MLVIRFFSKPFILYKYEIKISNTKLYFVLTYCITFAIKFVIWSLMTRVRFAPKK